MASTMQEDVLQALDGDDIAEVLQNPKRLEEIGFDAGGLTAKQVKQNLEGIQAGLSKANSKPLNPVAEPKKKGGRSKRDVDGEGLTKKEAEAAAQAIYREAVSKGVITEVERAWQFNLKSAKQAPIKESALQAFELADGNRKEVEEKLRALGRERGAGRYTQEALNRIVQRTARDFQHEDTAAALQGKKTKGEWEQQAPFVDRQKAVLRDSGSREAAARSKRQEVAKTFQKLDAEKEAEYARWLYQNKVRPGSLRGRLERRRLGMDFGAQKRDAKRRIKAEAKTASRVESGGFFGRVRKRIAGVDTRGAAGQVASAAGAKAKKAGLAAGRTILRASTATSDAGSRVSSHFSDKLGPIGAFASVTRLLNRQARRVAILGLLAGLLFIPVGFFTFSGWSIVAAGMIIISALYFVFLNAIKVVASIAVAAINGIYGIMVGLVVRFVESVLDLIKGGSQGNAPCVEGDTTLSPSTSWCDGHKIAAQGLIPAAELNAINISLLDPNTLKPTMDSKPLIQVFGEVTGLYSLDLSSAFAGFFGNGFDSFVRDGNIYIVTLVFLVPTALVAWLAYTKIVRPALREGGMASG